MTAATHQNLEFRQISLLSTAAPATMGSKDATRISLFFIFNPLFSQADAELVLFGGKGVVGRVMNSARRTVLTSAEEKALFLEFNYCRFREAQAATASRLNSASDELERQESLWHQSAMERRDRLVECNLGLVAMMIRNVRAMGTDYDELLSEGNLTLLNAVSKFDVNRGFRFSTYACQAIHHAIALTMARRRRRPWASLSEGLDVAAEAQETGAYVDEIPRVTEMLSRNDAKLSVVELQVIRSRFALHAPATRESIDGPLTREEIGRMIGVSKERIRQIERNALSKLRETLALRYGHEMVSA